MRQKRIANKKRMHKIKKNKNKELGKDIPGKWKLKFKKKKKKE